MFTFHAELQGHDALLRRLQALAVDWRELHRAAGETILANAADRFRTETGPDGKRWAALARARRRRGRGRGRDRVLQDTGRLRGSISARATASEAQVGTSLVYAARHNFGWTESKPNTPARPFLGVGAELQGELADTVRDFLGDLP